MQRLQQEELPTETSTDSFRDLLAQTFDDLPDAVKQEVLAGSTYTKDVTSGYSGHSDVEHRKDAAPGLTTAATSAQQISHHSSGAGSEQGTSSSQHEQDHGRGRGRGRGRRSKRVAGQQETAQQRAHRRFYERKKAKMAALEQEFADKQVEYQRLMLENAELKRKHDALEWTIAGRDEQMSLLQALSSLTLNPQTPQALSRQEPGASEMPPPQRLSSGASTYTAAVPSAARGSSAVFHRRSGSASQMCAQQQPPYVPQQQQQHQQQQAAMAEQYAAAGPFGMVQVIAQAQEELPAWSAAATSLQQPRTQQQQQHWPDQPPYIQQQQQGAAVAGSLHLQRSISMPARSAAGASAAATTAAAVEGTSVLPGPPISVTAAAPRSQMQRSYSSSPQALPGGGTLFSGQAAAAGGLYAGFAQHEQQQQRQSAPGGSIASGYPPFVTGWTAGPSRLQQVSAQQQQQQQPFQGEVLRPGSWSGPSSPNSDMGPPTATASASGVQRSSQSFTFGMSTGMDQQYVEPAQQQQQYLRSVSMPSGATAAHLGNNSAPAAAAAAAGVPVDPDDAVVGRSWLQPGAAGPSRRAMHTITTAGPQPVQQLLQQQQQQQQMQRTGSDPTAYTSRSLLPAAAQSAQQQQIWQQQQQQGLLSGYQLPQQVQQQQLHAVTQQQQQRYTLAQQQMQQQLEQQLANTQAAQPTEDDLMMIDDDLMLLLEQSLTQEDGFAMQTSSGTMLSPLPSIPSTTGEAAAAAAAAQQAGAAQPTPGSLPPLQQQQQVLSARSGIPVSPAVAAVQFSSSSAAAAAAAGLASVVRRTSTGTIVNILHASQLLQARHQALGWVPPVDSGELFYLHHMVEFHRAKITQMSALLPLVDCPVPDVTAGVSLVQVVEEVIMGLRKFSARNRVGYWELKLINLETGELSEAPLSHWRSVLHQLGMTPAQREQPLACFSLLQEYMEKCRQERLAILQDLAALETRLTGVAASGLAAAGPGSVAEALSSSNLPIPSPEQIQQTREQYLCPKTLQYRQDGLDEYQVLLERLHVSMTREHMIANMMMYNMVQVVSHAQMAKAMVASYPYWPNGYALLLLMQEEEAAGAAARQDKGSRG